MSDKHYGPCDGFGVGGDCSLCTGEVECAFCGVGRSSCSCTSPAAIARSVTVREAVAARDAEWRAAVERVRESANTAKVTSGVDADLADKLAGIAICTLDALLRAMEAPDA